jgi:phage baseplate assembly protein W
MNDIFHEWGGDLVVGSGGDLAIASGSDAISQRVCRRLLTNRGDYVWNIAYGGGLAQFVGLPANPTDIEAVIMDQLLLENAVPSTPAPHVTTTLVDPASGKVAVDITYTNPTTQRSVMLKVTAGDNYEIKS